MIVGARVERSVRNAEVEGSIPFRSTRKAMYCNHLRQASRSVFPTDNIFYQQVTVYKYAAYSVTTFPSLPDANGRLDNRIPRDSRLTILPDAGKTGTDGENLSYSTSRERKDCYHVGNERGSVSEQRRLADSRPPAHP